MVMKKENLEKTCYKYSWYFCEYEENCNYVEKNFLCARHYIDTLQQSFPEDFKILEKDLVKRGVLLMGVEAHLLRLATSDFEVKKANNETTSLRNILADKYFLPFVLEIEQKKENKYQLRPSEFSSECQIARLISKLKKEILEKYEASESARIGLLAHAICNRQPKKYYHNNTLTYIGCKPLNREKYCEKTVGCEIGGVILQGSSDVILKVKDTNSLAIFDFKRRIKGIKENKKILFQLLAYAVGVEQVTKNKFDSYFLITAKTPFPPKNQPRAPEYNITFVEKNSPLFDDFKKEISNTVAIQKELANSGSAALDYISKKRKSGDCFCNEYNMQCFSLKICLDIEENLKDGKISAINKILEDNVNL